MKTHGLDETQQGWNCFDIAVGLSGEFGISATTPEEIALLTRQELVKRALENSDNIHYRQLLAPEIRHAVALTVTYMLLENAENDDEVKNALNLEALFQLYQFLDESDSYNQQIIQQKIHELLEQKNQLHFPAGSLPKSMRTDEIKNIVIQYQQAHEEMGAFVSKLNDEMELTDNKRISFADLDNHFHDEENKNRNAKLFEYFKKK